MEPERHLQKRALCLVQAVALKPSDIRVAAALKPEMSASGPKDPIEQCGGGERSMPGVADSEHIGPSTCYEEWIKLWELPKTSGELKRYGGVRSVMFIKGDVDDLLRAAYRLRALGNEVDAHNQQSDVAIEIERSADGSVIVYPAVVA